MIKNNIEIFKEDSFDGEYTGKVLGVKTPVSKDDICYLEEYRTGNLGDVKACIYLQNGDEPLHVHPLTLVLNDDGDLVANKGVTIKHLDAEIVRAKDAIELLNDYIYQLNQVKTQAV